jgi:hypothetical protein
MVKARYLLLMAVTGFFIFFITRFCFAEWEIASHGITEPGANLVVVDRDSGAVYAGTDHFVYVSEGEGNSWKQIFSASGQSNKINFIGVMPENGLSLLVAADDGLYVSFDSGKEWRRTYQKKVNCIFCAAQERVYIGTDEGIFFSDDKAGAWQLMTAGLGTIAVKSIGAGSAEKIYACTDDRIFRSDNSGNTWALVYSLIRKDIPEEALYEEFPEEQEELFARINYVSVDPQNPQHVYAATTKGVLFSSNEGRDWSYMTRLGLDASEVKHVIIVDSSPYAATYKGVFVYSRSDARWIQAYSGASIKSANFLSADSKNSVIWVAAGNGVFKAKAADGFISSGIQGLPRHIKEKFKNEPSVTDVQRAAIKYAEVHPEKIESWRKSAAKKALFPKISTNVGNNVTDFWHWETGSSTRAYDDVLMKGDQALEWSVGASWDLGEMIWNSDQTSIDVRSRLMVELRDDILDDVTRLYYERRRLQVDMLTSPPRSEKEYYDKLLRVEELTANMDALTGGYFSTQLHGPSENLSLY